MAYDYNDLDNYVNAREVKKDTEVVAPEEDVHDSLDKYLTAREATPAKPAATKTNAADLDFTYSDVPVPQGITTEVLHEGGAGIDRGLRNVGESIGNAELWAANKLGFTSDEDYKDVADIRRNRLQGYNAKYGDSKLAQLGVVGGELAAGLPLGAAASTLAGAGMAAVPAVELGLGALQGTRIGSLLSGAGTVATNAGRGAIAGAGGNALISAGSESPLIDQLNQGAMVGAGLGVGLPLAAGGIGWGINKARNVFASPDLNAANKIMQNLGRDGLTLDGLESSVEAMGKNASILDAGGGNTLKLADTVGNIPGAGREKVANFLNERQAGQGERVMDAVADGLKINPEVNYEGHIDDLISQRKTTAAPLYDKAFSAAPVHSAKIEQFLADPVMQSGLKKGLQIQRLESLAEGKPFNAMDYGITGFNDAGDPIIGAVPNMRLLDAGKKGLDSIIAENTDQFGKVSELGRAVVKVKNSYLNELDTINPDYAAARKAFSDTSQSIDAMDKGKKFIKNGAYGNVKDLAKMSDEDKQFFRIGVGKTITDMLDGTKAGADSADRIMGTPKMQKALKSVFQTDEAYEKFSKTINDEIKFHTNRRAILGGSPTAPRLAAMEDAAQDAVVGFNDIANVAKGNYGSATIGIGTKLKNKLTQMSPAKADAIAEIMVSKDPKSAINKLRGLTTPRELTGFERILRSKDFPKLRFGVNKLVSDNDRK